MGRGDGGGAGKRLTLATFFITSSAHALKNPSPLLMGVFILSAQSSAPHRGRDLVYTTVNPPEGRDSREPPMRFILHRFFKCMLSIRPASIGPVKSILRRTDLGELRTVIHQAREDGAQSVRPTVMEYLRGKL